MGSLITHSVDLNSVKPSLQRPLHSTSESELELNDILRGHLLGFSMVLVPRDSTRSVDIVRPAVEFLAGHSTGGEPGSDGTRFPARMAELDHHLLPLAVGEFDHFAQVLDLAVFPQAVVFGGDAALQDVV